MSWVLLFLLGVGWGAGGSGVVVGEAGGQLAVGVGLGERARWPSARRWPRRRRRRRSAPAAPRGPRARRGRRRAWRGRRPACRPCPSTPRWSASCARRSPRSRASAYWVDCGVRSSVRKKPGSTSMVRMPNGATSGARRLHEALDAELGGGVGGEEVAGRGDAGGRGDRHDQTRSAGRAAAGGRRG